MVVVVAMVEMGAEHVQQEPSVTATQCTVPSCMALVARLKCYAHLSPIYLSTHTYSAAAHSPNPVCLLPPAEPPASAAPCTALTWA
jgi:hypothetical protein